MKTIEQVLNEVPRHDCAYVLYNGRWHRIEEHELRAIQVAVAKGELNSDDVRVKVKGEELRWNNNEMSKGRFESKLHDFSNIYTLDGFYSVQLNKINIDTIDKQLKYGRN